MMQADVFPKLKMEPDMRPKQGFYLMISRAMILASIPNGEIH